VTAPLRARSIAALDRGLRRGCDRDRFSTGTLVIALLALAWLAAAAGAQTAATGETAAADRHKSLEESTILGPPQGRPLAGAELDATARSLGQRMRCPVCQGMSIADSPSASASSMMAEVRDLLARGYTEQQVLDYFVRSYGEFVLLQPTAKGFNLMVWVLPVLGVAAGALLIVLRLRAARRNRGGAAASSDDLEAGDPAERELDRYVERVRTEVADPPRSGVGR
jgi:cytochrome c-type biogenesis protein CcmH